MRGKRRLVLSGFLVVLSTASVVAQPIALGGPDLTTIGTNPHGPAIGDLDGDGRLDLVVPQDGSGRVSILWGRPDGTLGDVLDIPLASQPFAATLADFDRDGLLDFAVSYSRDGLLEVHLNAGSRSFQDPTSLSVSETPLFLTAADLNGDGFDDLVVACQGSGTTDVIFNLGGAGFSSATSVAGPAGARSVVAADFDRDGDLDLAVGSQTTGTLTVLRNDGAASFAIETPLATGGTTYQIIAVDLDRDGDVDLASADHGAGVSIFLNDGSGAFAPAVSWSFGTSPAALTAADFNGDGEMDLAVAACSSSTVSYRPGEGGGRFGPLTNLSGMGSCPHGIVTGDVDRDGRPDAVSVQWYGGTVALMTNHTEFRPAGEFTARKAHEVGAGPRSVVVGDWNGDGVPDAATADSDAGQVTPLLGRGDGTLVPQVPVPIPFTFGPSRLLSLDFDCDGNLDLAVAGSDTGVLVLLGGGDGSFVVGPSSTLAEQAWPNDIAAGDVDRDGDPDLLIVTRFQGAYLHENDGAGGLLPPVEVDALNVADDSLVLADLNRDGVLDLIRRDLVRVWVTPGVGDGSFVDHSPQDLAAWGWGLGVGDLNADGWPDLAVGGSHGDSSVISVLLNDGAGGLLPASEYPVGLLPTNRLTLVDLNRDGTLDVVVPGSDGDSANAAWLPGDGLGALGTARLLEAGAAAEEVVAVDLRGTGRLDLLAADSTSNTLSVLQDDACIEPPLGLVAAWSAEEDVVDRVLGLTGTRMGDAGFADGMAGRAFTFDGDGDAVLVPDHPALNLTGPIGFGAWIRRRGDSGGLVLLKGGADGSSSNSSYSLSVTPAGAVTVSFLDSSGGGVYTSEDGLIQPDRWHHVFAHWSGSIHEVGGVGISIDGRLRASFDKVSTMQTTSQGLWIGGQGDGDQVFDGEIDEVWLSGHQSEHDVLALWQSGSAGLCPLDSTPDALSFEQVFGAELDTPVSTPAVRPLGFNASSPVAVTGGEFSASSDDGANWSGWSDSGWLEPGDLLRLRLISASSPNQLSTATLNLGGLTVEFSVRTWTDVRGDGYPMGGDGVVDLLDFIDGHLKYRGLLQIDWRDQSYHDVAPGASACVVENGPDTWCAVGDGEFTLEDLLLQRARAAGVLAFSCESCGSLSSLPSGASLRLPGDVAPTGDGMLVGDGDIAVEDVLLALRFAVSLSTPTTEQSLRADVSPASPMEGLSVVSGDGMLDVSDVLLLLRAAVQLETLAWPERALAIELDAGAERVAFQASMTGWPDWAVSSGFEADGCDETAGLDIDEGLRVLTCADETEPLPSGTSLARLRYRGPVAVEVSDLSLSTRLAAADFSDVAVGTSYAEPP